MSNSKAEKIKKKRADYVLSLKGNQKNLYEDVKEYFEDKHANIHRNPYNVQLRGMHE